MSKFYFIFCYAIALSACSVKDKTITVQFLPSPTTPTSGEPWLFTDSTGTVFLSWIEEQGATHFLKYARLENDTWSQPVLIDSGKNWFVNWADFPVMTGDGSNRFVASILEKSGEETYAYDVRLLTSPDGVAWRSPGLLHHDSVQAEHGFVSLVPYNKGVFASWLDGRHTGGGGHDHEGHGGAMTIRAATLDYTGKKIQEWELDNRVCDCCQTTAAITDNGPVVIYRDRSDAEIRDISIVRFVNGSWTDPQSIYVDNWKINGCPVNGPRCEFFGNTLAIAWFSATDDQPEVKVIFSTDGGYSFGDPVRIDKSNTIGRVDIVLLDEQRALVSWMEGATIKVAVVTADGKKQETVTVARSSEARSAGFPQLAKSGERIIMAWTDEETGTIKTASLRL